MKESDIQRLIMDYLAARGILAFRMNTGAMGGSHNGKRWFVRFGSRGMADILAFPRSIAASRVPADMRPPNVLWIEVKTPTGKQSDYQLAFSDAVRSYGHSYIVARSLEDVKQAL